MKSSIPQLTIQQLEYLTAVAAEDTWAQAAQRLQVTPSALSQGLAELERRLGVKLFERQGRRRVLSAEAHHVVDYAKNVVAQTTDLGRWAEDTKSGTSGTLRVGMIDVGAVAHFPNTLRTFREQNPKLDLHLTVAPSKELVNGVLSGQLAFALVVKPSIPLSDCRLTEVLAEDLAIYSPRQIKQRNPQKWGPWVLFPEASHTRQLVTTALRACGAPVNVSAVSNQPDVLREMVNLDMGWTVLPVVQAEHGPAPLSRARPAPLVQRHLVVAQRHAALPNPAAERLIEALLTAAQNLQPTAT